MPKTTVTLNVTFEVSFEEYDTAVKNRKAVSSIKSWVKHTLDEARFVPLYVDKDEGGAYIEDCTRAAKIKIDLSVNSNTPKARKQVLYKSPDGMGCSVAPGDVVGVDLLLGDKDSDVSLLLSRGEAVYECSSLFFGKFSHKDGYFVATDDGEGYVNISNSLADLLIKVFGK